MFDITVANLGNICNFVLCWLQLFEHSGLRSILNRSVLSAYLNDGALLVNTNRQCGDC
jgi:hypothetical protein